ncbi:MAG: hypothetical protein LC804_16620 [Acidobacteria bacterium]|nr:hypothetical protein [Acidobacteriota bacterium]
MRPATRILLTAALLMFPSPSLLAQTAGDPAGHWEGTVQAPNMAVKVEIDLAKNSKGELAGTFGQPAQGVKGLPLSTVAVNGRSVRFVVKAGPDISTFEAVLAEDGKSMSGDVTLAGQSVPFTLTRTGDARIAPTPKSPAIGKELEGTWNGTLDGGGRQQRLVLKMANQADGTAAGTIVSLDGSGVEIPIAMAQKGSNLTIDVPSVGVSYAGVLNAAGTELVGTWTHGPAVVPLTFRRGTPR